MSSNRKNKTYKVGITGSVASGKSLVQQQLAKSGLSVLDTMDVIYTILAGNPSLTQQLTKHFGKDVVDTHGHISRKKLEKIQFENPMERKFFEETVSPLVREEIKRFLFGPLGTYIRAVESPRLFETESQHLYDEVWVVKVNPKVQLQRMMERDHLLLEEAELRVLAEWPQEKKIEIADRIIDNSGDRHSTEIQVREALDEIKNKVFSIGF